MRWAPLLLLCVAANTTPAPGSLGNIDFPVTGSPAAREHFLRGVLALHSFFYDEALEEFRASTKAEPGFAMGHWGEAMALNQTIWQGQDTEGARKTLAAIGDTSKLTPRERGFIDAARILFGPGTDKRARDQAYAAAMAKLGAELPDDLEVKSFQALALLGTITPRSPALSARMRAGALALEVLARNPNHPGAAHYVIHAFDDSDHAPLALPAARRYAQIAPAAFHARHMPAHIFVNLGMWEDAAASCESAWAASEEWVARRHHEIGKKDYHSLEWLVMIYHQQGRRAKAEEALARYADAVKKSGDMGLAQGYAYTALDYLARTGHLDKLDEALAVIRPGAAPAAKESAEPGCHSPAAGGSPDTDAIRLPMTLANVRAYAAAARGDAAEVEKLFGIAAKQRDLLKGEPDHDLMVWRAPIFEARVRAQLLAAQKKWPEAEARMRERLKLGAGSPYRGAAAPAGMDDDSELGAILMGAGRPADALAAYVEALHYTPGDSVALLGAARTARASGDQAAAAGYYRQLASQWKNAEAGFPDLDEVRAGAK